MDLATAVEEFAERDWQTTDEGTVRFALVGLGWWVTDVAVPAIEDADLCETAVFVSGSAEKAERLADRHDAAAGLTYDEFTDGAAVDAYDAVYVCTPNALHLEYVEAAAEHDKAVLCEKPLEASVDRAERLVEAGSDVPLMTAYRMQTEPVVRRAKELVEAGFIGDPVQAYGNNTQRILDIIPDADQWRLDPELSGYGTSVMDLGIYPVNTLRYLLDSAPVRATARMASVDPAFADVPDQHASFTLVYEGDVPLLCTTSQHAQDDTELKIVGTEGKIEIQPAFHGAATLSLSKGDTRVEVENVEHDAVFEMREEFDYFADRVLSGTDVGPDGREGLADLRAIAAVHEAAERDETVEV